MPGPPSPLLGSGRGSATPERQTGLRAPGGGGALCSHRAQPAVLRRRQAARLPPFPHQAPSLLGAGNRPGTLLAWAGRAAARGIVARGAGGAPRFGAYGFGKCRCAVGSGPRYQILSRVARIKKTTEMRESHAKRVRETLAILAWPWVF